MQHFLRTHARHKNNRDGYMDSRTHARHKNNRDGYMDSRIHARHKNNRDGYMDSRPTDTCRQPPGKMSS
jgi:hypothetical protein